MWHACADSADELSATDTLAAALLARSDQMLHASDEIEESLKVCGHCMGHVCLVAGGKWLHSATRCCTQLTL